MAEELTPDYPDYASNGKLVEPRKALGLSDAIALIVGIVIGAGIFRTPSLVAANTANETMFILVWVFGGLISVVGALCYAELTTAFPNAGGDYHFLQRAFGKDLAFLFGWARMTVIQTGSIALLAFIFSDYVSEIYSIGSYSSVIYASLMVIALTAVNILGIKFGSGTQKLLTSFEVLGILMVIVAGFFFSPVNHAPLHDASPSQSTTSLGMAMVIVLLTFGGWNEAAYISAELRSGRKQMVRALIIGLTIITTIYLLINMAYLHTLGIGAMAASNAVGTEVMRLTFGRNGVILLGLLVALSALTSANATIFTGARTNYALGKDFKVFGSLGKWNHKKSTPVNAFIVQGLISLVLISFGFFTRNGFETIVQYTAPVFWLFFLLVGIALFILRIKEPYVKRPFRVPFYPVIPSIFCLTSTYLLYSSIMYTGIGALVGVAVLMGGVLLLFAIRRRSKKNIVQVDTPIVDM